MKSVDPSVQEKKGKQDFQDGRHGGHLGFPIGTILTKFGLQVTPMLSTKFEVNCLFGSGDEAKNIFSRWRHFSSFDVEVIPMLPTKFHVNWSRGVGRVGF